jgi:UDP-glucose 6-dehydrogenase
MVEKIVIVGFGQVGQANALALCRMGFQTSYYDPSGPRRHPSGPYASDYDRIASLSHLRAQDDPDTCYIVCIADKVSAEGKQDISDIAATLDELRGAQGQVILRSTILPDLLKPLPFDLYLPEFLREKTAVEDATNPSWVVIGRRSKRAFPEFIESWVRQAKRVFVGSPAEAAYIKYLSNIWNATRIAFVNEFGSSIVSPDLGAGLPEINRIVDFVMENKPYQRYGRAFDGRCLPKDTLAYLRWAQDNGCSMDMLAGMWAANNRHRLKPEHASLPEWFSDNPLSSEC